MARSCQIAPFEVMLTGKPLISMLGPWPPATARFSFKYSWDHLPQAWHMTQLHIFGWGLGPWLETHWTVARHYYGRNIPEGVAGDDAHRGAAKSVSKVADDVQLHFLEIRLKVAYAADKGCT
jgi:hypothetical protein